ncbi:MAG: hypothetical protein GX189_00885 [Clostridiales bacterium]|nr:hypothetical protein [Clostridiales bacterium]
MHAYQRHTTAFLLPGRARQSARIIRHPSCRRKKSLDSAEIWNVIFSVLAVAAAACVFVR